MRYLVNFPTRITDTSERVIDNVFTNIEKQLIHVTGLNTQLSDHDAQLVEISAVKLSNNTTYLEYCRKFNNYNVNNFLL